MKPEIVDHVGPHDPTAFDLYDMRISNVIGSLTIRIAEFSRDQLDENFYANGGPVKDFESRWVAIEADEIRMLKNNPPNWYVGGFGHSDYAADFKYWGQMAQLTLTEAVILSLGVEPKHLPQTMIEQRASSKDQIHPAMEFLVRRNEQFRRKFDPQSHGWRVKPADLHEWAVAVDLSAHPDFLRSVGARNFEDKSIAPSMPEKFDPREKVAMAKLLVAMAIDHYGYVPGSRRSPIPKEIEGLCDTLGLGLSHETIRNYLRLGETHLPNGSEEDYDTNR